MLRFDHLAFTTSPSSPDDHLQRIQAADWRGLPVDGKPKLFPKMTKFHRMNFADCFQVHDEPVPGAYRKSKVFWRECRQLVWHRIKSSAGPDA